MMDDNVRKIKMFKEHREDKCNTVTCMADACYNNPPKGRAMYQPGTLCVTPMLECEKTKNMVVALTSSVAYPEIN